MKKAQNLVEYALIFSLVAIVCLVFTSKMDLRAIKNYIFMRPADSTDSTKINIEAMTK